MHRLRGEKEAITIELSTLLNTSLIAHEHLKIAHHSANL